MIFIKEINKRRLPKKNENLRHHVLNVGTKVKLDPKTNPRVSSFMKRKIYKIDGFWYDGKKVKNDPTIGKPEFRTFSGVSIKDRNGNVYNVNRFQLKLFGKPKINKIRKLK